jgi:hypothetical protein
VVGRWKKIKATRGDAVLRETVEKVFVYITTAAAAAGATVQESQVVARLSRPVVVQTPTPNIVCQTTHTDRGWGREQGRTAVVFTRTGNLGSCFCMRGVRESVALVWLSL